MAAARKQQQGSLWGRLARHAARKERPAAPVASVPTHRPLTARDALYTVDGQGRRQYVPLVVDGAVRMAGRAWCHCGEMDGVLVVPWALRDEVWAPMRWRTLAGGLVCVVEGGMVA